jgi:hypothetical protein
VAEDGLGTLADVGLDLLPIVLVVSDLLAVGAYGKEALKKLDARQSLLQFPNSLGQ